MNNSKGKWPGQETNFAVVSDRKKCEGVVVPEEDLTLTRKIRKDGGKLESYLDHSLAYAGKCNGSFLEPDKKKGYIGAGYG